MTPNPPNPRPTMTDGRKQTWHQGWTLVAALALSAGLVSCNRDDSAQRAIDAANVKLETWSVSGSNVPGAPKERTKVFNDVVKTLDPIAKSDDAAYAPAAQLLVARAKGGLGELAASAAWENEQEIISRASVTRSLLDQWISQQSVASALKSYDPTKDLADLDKQASDRFAEAQRIQAEKDKQEKLVADIRARAEDARKRAKTERDREAGIRAQGEGKSQTEREQLLEQAVQAGRAADALERQAAELSAEADKEAPRIDELANTIERLERQVDSLKKEKDNINQRVTSSRTESEAAAKEAGDVGKKISDAVKELAAANEKAAGPTQDAVAKYKDAAKGASLAGKSAAREGKTAAATAQGTYQQAVGDVLSMRARSLAVYAATLDAIAKASPALPGAPEIAGKLDAANKELDATRKEAEQAYDDALAAFDKAGAGGDVKAKVEAVQAALKALKEERTKPVEQPKVAPPASGDAKPAAAETPAAPAGDAAAAALTPEQTKAVEDGARAALKQAADAMAAGDLAKLRDVIDLSTDEEKQAFDTAMGMIVNAKKLDDAAKAKFGKDVQGLLADSQAPGVKGNPMFMMIGPLMNAGKKQAEAMSPDNVDKATIKALSLTTADAQIPDDPTPTHLVKVGETWKIKGGDELKQGVAQMGPMAPMIKKLNDALAKLATDTAAGKYATADDMLTQLSAELTGAMGSMPGMPGMPPGGSNGKRPGGPKPAPGGGKPGGGGGGGGGG